LNPDSNGKPLPGESTDDDGVDETLIHWMLSLTPAERLRALQRHVNAVNRLRAAMREKTGQGREDGTPGDGKN
jgi:hypothetical protein